MSIRVFIVDDHLMVTEGIRSLLQDEKLIEWLGHATSASACLGFLQNSLPDVILMDINLPDKSGLDLCIEVKEKYPAVLIIGLSTFNQQTFIEKMLQNGASGYVLKDATRTELVQAITSAVSGKTYLSQEAAQALRKKDASGIILTRREKEVLELIAAGLTNGDISEKLFVSVTTVNTHRKNLLAKFDCRNIASLIVKAAKQGMV